MEYISAIEMAESMGEDRKSFVHRATKFFVKPVKIKGKNHYHKEDIRRVLRQEEERLSHEVACMENTIHRIEDRIGRVRKGITVLEEN